MLMQRLRQLGANPGEGDHGPLTERHIGELETRTGGPLPGSYRQMLAELGGCTPSEAVYYNDPVAKIPVMFGWFYDYSELMDAIKSYEEVLPDGVIPIGDDGGGNLYCLGVKGDDSGKVFFHDHGAGWDEEARSYLSRGDALPVHLRYQTVYLLAETFDDFVNGMWSEEG